MTLITSSAASGSRNDAKSGRSGAETGEWVNADRSIAGATSLGRAIAHAPAVG